MTPPYCPICGGRHNHMLGRFRHATRRGNRAHAQTATAWLRLVWHDFVIHALFDRGGERCERCGRGYGGVCWMAPDRLYAAVHGNRGGLLCPACFDRAARDAELSLMWTCFVWEGPDIKDRINASDWELS